MQKHLLTDGNREKHLVYPDSWDELSRKQAIYAGNLLYLLMNKELEVDQFRKLMVDKFINRDNRGIDKLSIDDSLNMWANESQLADTVNFFFKVTMPEKKEEPERYELLPTGILNLIPSFRHRGRKYHGPGVFLGGLSFLQYKDALSCAQKYMETHEEEWLTRLTATLYLPGKKKYDASEVDKYSGRLKGLNRGIKYMSFCYLMGCMYNLSTDGGGVGIELDSHFCRFSLLFKSTKEFNGPGESIGLLGVLMTLAESGVFGDIKATAEADVWDVLARLYQLKLEEIEMEKIYKK